MSWIENRFEEGLIITSLDWAINWGRSNSIFPMAFGLAFTIEFLHDADPQ